MDKEQELKSKVDPQDRDRIIRYMMANHCGYKRAVPRQDIADALGMPDRYFRTVCATIPEILTSCNYGYYILPLVDLTGEEMRVAREILEGENRRSLIASYLRHRKQREAIRRMEHKERQMELAL